MMQQEIERKWLMEGFPEGLLPEEERWEMEQGYLSFGPAVRIRRETRAGDTRYRLTIKGDGTLTRTEVELELTPEQYTALSGLLAAPAVLKEQRRYRLPEGRLLECNLVDAGSPTAFYYAEVEFASEAEAGAFQPPAFLGREVTEERGFSMAAYVRRKAGL